MSSELVSYKKQKSMFLILNPQGVTVDLCSNLKKAVAVINEMEAMKLQNDLSYSDVAWTLRKDGKFVFSLGGAVHSLIKFPIHGVFLNSKKQAHLFEGFDRPGLSISIGSDVLVKAASDASPNGSVSEEEFIARLKLDRKYVIILSCGNFRAYQTRSDTYFYLFDAYFARGKVSTYAKAAKWVEKQVTDHLVNSGVVG